ncbi:MAG: bis(5'-nucleosyl)-tetraphosphatase (symmetrical) YqeK [Lachnospiraceae bacterium]|nr:bis(5'-nucleosyl)-tetraphosphatase (symmetrical) YqeK [Lachnospiraceae bacterium]MDD6192404.1 bis(5'-nucleosyl)-tetraphosphatase (symmetrical) YqeK [Lachnospiraceae bacterium]
MTIQKEVQNELKPERFEHTLGVMYTAGNLAYRYHISSGKALVAGLLHDCAKCLSDERRLDICREQNIPMSDIEKKNPHLLHGKVGAYLAKEKYGISDDDVLHSIAVHTTGCVDMSILDKIIYVADYIEPHRDKAPRLPEIREMAYINLDQCVYMILEDTVNYLGNNPENLDETTVKTFEYYKNILKKGN